VSAALGKAAADCDSVACPADDAVAGTVCCLVDFVGHETWLDSRCRAMIIFVCIESGVTVGEG
jgi:hypothetical protein